MAPTPLFRSFGIFPVDRVARIMITIVVNPLRNLIDDYSFEISRILCKFLTGGMSFFLFLIIILLRYHGISSFLGIFNV